MSKIQNFSLRNLLFNRKFILVLSIIVSFVFWLIIAIDQSPERERTISNLKIEVDSDTIWGSETLKVVGDVSQTATVTVHGPNYIVSSLRADEIKVSADLSGISDAGVASVNLTPVRNSDESGYTFVSVSPSQITVKVDYYESKEFDANPIVNDIKRLDNPDYRYDTVFAFDGSSALPLEIHGFREDLNKIARVDVVSSADPDTIISETQNFESTAIKFYDSHGAELDASKYVTPEGNTTLQVSVKKVKNLPVLPTYQKMWNPDIATLLAKRWTVDVESVTVIGPPAVIDGLNSLDFTNPIDLTNLSPKNTENVFDLVPDLPDNVEILDGVDSVQFTFDMSGFVIKRFKVTNFSHEGTLGTNLEPIYPKAAYVEVCSLPDYFEDLTSNDYYLAVDLSDRKENGRETEEATFKTYIRKPIWQVVSCSVDVTVR